MKTEKLMDCIGRIDDNIIMEADEHSAKVKIVKRAWVKWAAVAACVCLIVAILFIFNQKSPSDISELPNPPVNTGPGTSAPEVDVSDVPDDSQSPDAQPGQDDPQKPEVQPVDASPSAELPGAYEPGESGAIGSGWYYFNRAYQDETYNIIYLGRVFGEETSILPEGALDEWVNEVFLKQSEEEQDRLPTMYQAIQGLGVSKEDLIALNEMRKEICRKKGIDGEGAVLPDEYIDALYLPEEEMKKALINPLALYYEGEIYTWEALCYKDTGKDMLKRIPASVMDEYIVRVITYCLKERVMPEHELVWYFGEGAVNRYYAQVDPPAPSDDFALPMLTADITFDGMGFEAHMVYDVNELRNGNPWIEANRLTTLPVFNNPNEYDGAGAPVNAISAEEMTAIAKKVADMFGLEIRSLYTEPTLEEIEKIRQKLEASNASEEEVRINTIVYGATAECDGAQISVYNQGRVILELTPETADLVYEIEKLRVYNSFCVSFNYGQKEVDGCTCSLGMPLPDGYSFSFKNTSEEQALRSTDYLFREYGAFAGITAPGYNVFADYTFSGELLRIGTSVFEDVGSLKERILNYNFNTLGFHASELGGLSAITYYKTDLSQKIGDYPIITAEEARELFFEKHYITSVPVELSGEEYIGRMELIYRTGALDKVFMPYYKFYVELPTMQRENGLRTFGIFYVPAVKAEYLESMPLWDGSFN